jgi:hypothetical protein
LASVHILLSAVTSEFRKYRDVLRRDLDRPNVSVKVQEDFIATGTETLVKLDEYIRECDAVVHLIGHMTGAFAQPPSVMAIRERYPDLATRFPALDGFLTPDGAALPYTQWEAWLALYHGKSLIIAVPEDGAPRDDAFVSDDAQRSVQIAHLARLRTVERFSEVRFASVDRLAVELLRSRLQDLLARVAPGDLSIDMVRVVQDQPQKTEDYFTEKKCLVDFWVTNRGSAQVVVLAADFEVLETGRAELVKGPMPSSETYDLDLTDVTTAGGHVVCKTSQVIAPKESDRFSIALVAKLRLGRFAAWRLRPSLQTNFGTVTCAPIEVWLPFKDRGTSFEELMEFAASEAIREAVDTAVETADGQLLLRTIDGLSLEQRERTEVAWALSQAARSEAIATQIGAELISRCDKFVVEGKDRAACASYAATCAWLYRRGGDNPMSLVYVVLSCINEPGNRDAIDLVMELVNTDVRTTPNMTQLIYLMTAQVQSGHLRQDVLFEFANALRQRVDGSATA